MYLADYCMIRVLLACIFHGIFKIIKQPIGGTFLGVEFMGIIVFVAVVVLYYCSYAYLYLWSSGFIPFTPAIAMVATLATGLLLALLKYGFVLPAPKYRNLMYWVAVFLTLSALSVAFTSNSQLAYQQLTHYAQGCSMLLVFSMLFRSGWIVNSGVKALVAVVLFGVTLNLLEFFGIASGMTDVQGRSAGMYVNPNISALYLILGFCITVLSLPKRIRLGYSLFVLVGVFVTFSRSGILIQGVIILYLAIIGAFVLARGPSIAIASAVVVSIGLAFTSGSLVDFLGKSAVEEYLTEDTTGRITGGAQADHSAGSRATAAMSGIDVFLQNPFIGVGVGGAIGLGEEGVNSHNVYVQSAVEMGLIGLILILTLYYLIWRCGTYETNLFLIALFMLGFFHHNILDQPAFFILVALVVSVSTRHTAEYPPFVRKLINVYWNEDINRMR